MRRGRGEGCDARPTGLNDDVNDNANDKLKSEWIKRPVTVMVAGRFYAFK